MTKDGLDLRFELCVELAAPDIRPPKLTSKPKTKTKKSLVSLYKSQPAMTLLLKRTNYNITHPQGPFSLIVFNSQVQTRSPHVH